ncbi:MAG: carbon-nitrogen hydrolase family protein, partial [Candidatus Thermoplasmatota archaeon]|nr:carbon-nitrogen hydrolase family protein [Candidatus Thermoplasmatota archaeon]
YSLGDEVFRHAMSLDNPIFEEVRSVCAETGKHVIFGFPQRSDRIKGQIHNSACLMGPEGILGVYQKQHLVDFGPFEEWAYFTPGKNLLLREVNGLKVGIMICYDLFFPELSKYYALCGADLLVCISASPSITRKYFESVMVARAIEDTVFFAYSNLVGFDSRMDFWGGGAIIGPRGNTLAKGPYYKPSRIRSVVDERSILTARRHRPTLRDTRSDLLDRLAGSSRSQK